MIPQLCPDGIADSIKRSQVMNRYLKHASISELKRLIDEAKSCLEMNESEVTEIPSGFKGGFFPIYLNLAYMLITTEKLANGTERLEGHQPRY